MGVRVLGNTVRVFGTWKTEVQSYRLRSTRFGVVMRFKILLPRAWIVLGTITRVRRRCSVFYLLRAFLFGFSVKIKTVILRKVVWSSHFFYW